MRIAELMEPHRFRLSEGPVAPPGPGELQVKVASVGICGSDLHNFAEGSVGDILSQYPMVLGHEPTGVITAVGEGATGWQPGDRVICEPAIYCYHCEYCRSGHHNVCENIRFLSQPGDPGYFRDYVNLPANNAMALPAGLSFDQGTLFEPLAIILHSMKFASISVGDTVAVFGGGPIGLLTAAVAKMSGAGRVWSVEPVAHRREMALKMGADAALDPNAVDPAATIWAETGKRGVDVAIDCATKGGSMNQCLRVARNAGRVVYTGIPVEAKVTLEFHVARRKELAIFNVRRSNHETETALAMMSAGISRFAPMLTHAVPVERIQGAFETLESYSDGIGKAVICF